MTAPATSAAAATAAKARYANMTRSEHSMVIASPRLLLGEILVQEGLTTADVVERALTRAQTTGELIGEALIALGAVTEDRSEERRVGKECRSRWSPYREKNKDVGVNRL